MNNLKLEHTVVLASADPILRRLLRASLVGMRWQVREAQGGAEAMAYLEEQPAEALIMDGWLPDLEVSAFAGEIRQLYPTMELLRIDGKVESAEGRSVRRHELLQALREATSTSGFDGPAWASAPVVIPTSAPPATSVWTSGAGRRVSPAIKQPASNSLGRTSPAASSPVEASIPELVGQSAPMRELVRMIQLVAPHSARVLIEGETGTGKELVARALHALSGRVAKPFIVLNCAAIPEALLEAELFGHTRGAFTGAVQSRVGRIEAAHGGTLFLDEIGEMALPLQAKLLRFLENGELQRVGDNESICVDVRVIAATHKQLDECAEEGSFRLDLLHRLAVFPIEVPSLRERLEDIPLLAEHFLSHLAKSATRKYLSPAAMDTLKQHRWPGNVRELGHVLQRAAILAGNNPEITPEEIKMRRSGQRSTWQH